MPTIYGENFFRVSNLQKDIRIQPASEVAVSKKVVASEAANKDKKKPDNHPACIMCDHKGQGFCDDCLAIRDIYV